LSVFLDTYAIIEMARDNLHYDPIESETVVTSIWDLLEAYYILAQEGEGQLAERAFHKLAPVASEVPVDLVPVIARFRLERKGTTGRRFSYADAAGYVFARDRGLEFVTGAHEFEGFPGVRFLR
jgi:hypothetical protein